MGVFVFGSSAAPMTTRTFGDLKRAVAGVVAMRTSDPDSVGAGDAILYVLRFLNGYRWDFLTVAGNDITLANYSGLSPGDEGYQGRYTVPARVRDFVSAKVRFGSSTPGGQPLEWVHRSEWDRLVNTSAGMGTRYITDFEHGTTGQVELLDWPGADGTMELRYWRKLTLPTANDETLDLPADGALESYCEAKAKYIVAADKGNVQKAAIYRDEARECFKVALAEDRLKVLHDPEWTPLHEWRQGHVSRSPRWEGYGVIRNGRWRP